MWAVAGLLYVFAPHFTCALGGQRAYCPTVAVTPKQKIRALDLHGFKHFKLLSPILEKLHDNACRRDRGHNRKLHYDQYAALILLYFFNPIVTSLRGIQQTSQLM